MPVKIEFTLDCSADELRAVARLIEYRLDTNEEKQLKLPLRVPPVAAVDVIDALHDPEQEQEPSFDPDDRDSDGLPWDERIHSSGRVKSSDGRWRQRRGVDKLVLATVTAALRGDVAAPPAPPPPPPPLAPVEAAVPLPPPPPAVAQTLTQVMPRLTASLASGALTQARLYEVCTQVGLTTGLMGLHERPDLIPGVMEALGV